MTIPKRHVKRTCTTTFLFIGVLLLNACTNISSQSVHELQLNNFHNPEEQIYTSAQPSKEQLTLLAKTDVKHIINLRSKSEQSWNEGEFVNHLGMNYHSIEVKGALGVTQENAHKLSNLLNQIDGEPVLLHCASGNRVGALIAVREGLLLNKNTDDAIETGKKWGLTGLEPIVREKLDQR